MQSQNKFQSIWIFLIAGLALLGLFDAVYLTYEHYNAAPIPCTVTEGCETVTTSKYSVLLGLPISVFGAGFYLTALVLAIVISARARSWMVNLLVLLGSLAFVTSLLLVYLQIFVIEALCFFCLVSAGVSILVFVFSLVLKKSYYHFKNQGQPLPTFSHPPHTWGGK